MVKPPASRQDFLPAPHPARQGQAGESEPHAVLFTLQPPEGPTAPARKSGHAPLPAPPAPPARPSAPGPEPGTGIAGNPQSWLRADAVWASVHTEHPALHEGFESQACRSAPSPAPFQRQH